MQTRIGDIWTSTDIFTCVLVNLEQKSNGNLVMGAGQAKEAVKRWPGVAQHWGEGRLTDPNTLPTELAYIIGHGRVLLPFPTKYRWREPSDLKLVTKSAHQLTAFLNKMQELGAYESGNRKLTCSLPRPGCGLGGLKWETVEPILSKILDDRFSVWSFK